jgi:hypothetical protein
LEELLKEPPAALTFLVAQLDSQVVMPDDSVEFWPRPPVGAVALMLVSDLVTRPDLVSYSVPELSWDAILERQDPDVPSRQLYSDFVQKYGRDAVRKKVNTILAKRGALTWDRNDRLFKAGP